MAQAEGMGGMNISDAVAYAVQSPHGPAPGPPASGLGQSGYQSACPSEHM